MSEAANKSEYTPDTTTETVHTTANGKPTITNGTSNGKSRMANTTTTTTVGNARGGDGTSSRKQIFIPYMSDHGHIMAAAMRNHGLPARVLEPTTDETRIKGLHVCKGKECLPCLTTTGDILHRAQQADFDPHQSAIFMPTTSGSCRFGCYNVLQREILEEHGIKGVEFLSPSASNAYQGLGEHPTQLRLLIWQGAVAIDLLYKLLHHFRPYERTPGQTDTIYQEAVQRITKAIEDGGGKRTLEEMKWIAKQFEGISVDRSQPRPHIGLVGEIYLRFNHHVNLELVRQVEQAGGEVQIASIAEWLYYTNWAHKRNSRAEGDTFRFIKTHITDKVQQFIDHQLIKTIDHLIDNAHDTSIPELMDNLKPYYHPALHSEAILTMGASIDFAKRGFSGILNVMPFSCMPGTITAGMAPRIREDWDNIPWLDISYDAQEGTNIKTRLEAFMYQAMQYMRRKQREDKEKELVA